MEIVPKHMIEHKLHCDGYCTFNSYSVSLDILMSNNEMHLDLKHSLRCILPKLPMMEFKIS